MCAAHSVDLYVVSLDSSLVLCWGHASVIYACKPVLQDAGSRHATEPVTNPGQRRAPSGGSAAHQEHALEVDVNDLIKVCLGHVHEGCAAHDAWSGTHVACRSAQSQTVATGIEGTAASQDQSCMHRAILCFRKSQP